MFIRKELKHRAKTAFKRYYWKCVLAALIVVLFTGSGYNRITKKINSSSHSNYSTHYDSQNPVIDFLDGNVTHIGSGTPAQVTQGVFRIVQSFFSNLPIGFIMILASVGILIGIIGIVVKILILNMIEIGGCKFFISNSDSEYTGIEPQLNELLCGFGNGNYAANIMTQFLRGIFTFLWSLLLVIPGIIKSYEYCMIPYLLAEYPDMTSEEAFRESRDMMYGNKMNTFILDLSFLGWDILNGITLGILGIFYINPYKCAAKAELYQALRLHAENRKDCL